MVNMGQRHCTRDIESALIFLLEDNIWRALIDPDAETFQLLLYDTLICKRLVDIQDNEYQVAGFCDRNDLTATAFAIFGALDDTREVKHLDLSTIVYDLAGNCCEGCELIGGRFRVRASQLRQQSTFADGRKAYETDTGYTSTCDVKADCGPTCEQMERRQD